MAVWLYNYRWHALVGVLLVTVLAAAPALQVRVDTSVQNWFTEGDPALDAYRDFQATYGNDEVVLIGLHREAGLLTPSGLSMLRTATERVRAVDGVASVRSLATQERVQSSMAGPQFVPLIGEDSISAEQARAIRSHVRSDSAYAQLVSDDGTMAALHARMARNAVIDGRRGAILDSIRHALAPLDASSHLAGVGVILDAINEASTSDSFLFVLASSVLIYLLLWGYFRRIGPVLLTLGVVGVSTVWLMGAYGGAGKDINMVTVVMPTLVMVVCVADCVHLLVYAADCPDALSPRERTIRTLSHLATPCLVTTLTTAAGFASLTSSSMAIVRTLGLFSAIGVVAGIVVVFVGAAVALPYEAMLPNRRASGGLQRAVDGLVGTGLRHGRTVLGATLVLVAAAGVGLSAVEADTNPIGYLFDDHEVRRDSRLLERTLGAYAPLEFVVQSDSSVIAPPLFRAVGQWQNRAVATGAVEWHHSPVDAVRRLHAAMPGGTATVPSSADRLRGLVQLGRDRDTTLADLQAHPNQLRVTFGMPIQSADGIRRAIDSVRAAAALPGAATLQPTGYLPLYVRMMRLLTDSLAWSFGLALVVVLGLIGGFFRSVRAALLSLGPNGLPVLAALGLMGGLGIPLDAATMTVAAVVFGLVVDDTIHVIHSYLTADETTSIRAAVRTSARQVGPRMAITTTVLAGGFLVLCMAQIKSIVWLGFLSAVAIGTALLADLLVLPALLTVLYDVGQSQLASS